MRKTSIFFHCLGCALILATAIIAIVKMGPHGIYADVYKNALMDVARMTAWHSIAIAVCLALGKVTDRR